MKITSLSAAALAAALLVGTACAGFPDEDGHSSRKLQGKDKDKGLVKDKEGRINDNLTPAGPPVSHGKDGAVGLIIKYKNDRGFNKAMDIASDGKVKGISSLKNIAALTVARDRVKDLLNDPNIEYVDYDYEVTALPHVRGSDAETSDAAGGEHRRLADEVPWGIDTVNPESNTWPNRLPQGTQKQVKVCVVDTG